MAVSIIKPSQDQLRCPEDFTIYRSPARVLAWNLPDFEEDPRGPISASHRKSPIWSYSDEVYFAWEVDPAVQLPGNRVIFHARSMICFADARKNVSVTLRVPENNAPRYCATLGDDGSIKALFELVGKKWQPRDNHIEHLRPFIGDVSRAEIGVHDKEEGYLLNRELIAEALFEAIFGADQESGNGKFVSSGLVIISGQTGSGKSTILSKLLRRYMERFDQRAWGKGRAPHVVTIEDPIERRPLKNSTELNVTARQLRFDVSTQAEGLLHALRQTPAVVMIGEIRELDDWKRVLGFAATGHLCLTTTHAGSLVETMRNVIEATSATTPDLRSSIAEKLLAVANLRQLSLNGKWGGSDIKILINGQQKTSMLLPAVWRNTGGGTNFFVSDGLSAILPRRCSVADASIPSCRGRSDFLERILQLDSKLALSRSNARAIRQVALKADLEGM